MDQPDISVVLALHREAPYVARMWESLAEAARFARADGISTELVAVLDCADSATEKALQSCDSSAFSDVRIIKVNNGSLGPTRNDGVSASRGRYIATADGDDLVSYNYFQNLFRTAEKYGPKSIIIPKFLLAFGSSYHVAEYFDLEDVTPLALFGDHPFISRIFFHRSLTYQCRYSDVSISRGGYAYEDWHFNCEAVALGNSLRVAPEAILFYRQRGSSLLGHSNLLSTRQIPPSSFFRPDVFHEICRPFAKRLEDHGDYRKQVRVIGKAILADPVALEMIAAANSLEPAIDPRCLSDAPYMNYLSQSLDSALAYDRLCAIIGDQQFDEVFLLPFLTTGGADRYILDIMSELACLNPRTRILVLFGQPFDRYAWLDQLPEGAVSLDLVRLCPGLDDWGRDLVCFKLLQSSARRARIHIKSSAFAQRFFSRFARIFAANRPVFYRFSDGRNIYGDLVLTEPSGFHFVSEHLEYLDTILCDNAGIVVSDQRRLCAVPEKWRVLPSRMDMPRTTSLDEADTGKLPRSILWISRIDQEKRPSLLVEIARLLSHRLPDVTLEVYGRATLGSFDVRRLSALPNVNYHGDFEKFEDTKPESHYCFVYTSSFDGIPVVLLEVMAAGLAVIAPDVGAIAEVVRDGETGLLLSCSGDDAADAKLYVSAIEALFNDPALRSHMRQRARNLILERHAPHSYAANVARIFGSRVSSATDFEPAMNLEPRAVS